MDIILQFAITDTVTLDSQRHTPNDTTKPFSFISTRVGKISFRATQKGLPKFGTNSAVEELYSNECERLARGKFGKHYSLSKVLSPAV